MNNSRIKKLVGSLDGAIKYAPMIADHPKWSDAECVAFARKWHDVAVARLKSGDPRWNNGIPYCRNDSTKVKQ
jgi:hypothetical protein